MKFPLPNLFSTLTKLPCLVLITTLSACNTLTPGGFGASSSNNSPQASLQSQSPEAAPAGREIEDDIKCSATHSGEEDYVVSDYENLWDRVRAGYALSYTHNPRIDTYVKWYTKNPSYMARVSERAEKYLFHIVEELEANNIPLEIALLPIVESAFDPFAYSHGRASGMWQFVPATGRQYGLKQNWWYDGRRDVVASTQAAIDYLSHLNKRYKGDWLLALAAYNSGEGNVAKALRKNRKAGKPTDFWSLQLPRETRAYVPQLLALSKVVLNESAHKVQLNPIANKPWFTVIDVGSQIDLAQAARMADMDIDQLYKLNPGFNRWATDPDGPHSLLIPLDHAEQFSNALSALPADKRIGWKRYTIKPGDSLLRISKQHNTSVDALKKANSIRGNTIRAGKALMIPVATASAEHYSYSAEERLRKKQNGSSLSKSKNKHFYTVRAGDSFWKISRHYKVSVGQLSKWNGMAPGDPIKPGQKLVVWTDKQIDSNRISAKSGDKGIIRKVAYNVRRGDSLARIAGKFNLSVNDIVKWNPVKKNSYIHPGQRLTLFVDVTRTN